MPAAGSQAFLAFAAGLEGAQFAVDKLQAVDVAMAEDSAVGEKVEEVIPGAVG